MTTFQLREMQPADSAAVSKLVTEMTGFMTTHFIVDAYHAMIECADLRTLAAVAEAEGHDGLAGIASVRFGECQFNGEVLPFAFLDSLKVDERFRRQGLGVAATRITAAREERPARPALDDHRPIALLAVDAGLDRLHRVAFGIDVDDIPALRIAAAAEKRPPLALP